MFVSIRMPTVPPSRIAVNSPRPKSSLCSTKLPCRHRISLTYASSRRLSSLPNDHPHRIAHQRVVEARKLPCAQVPGNNQHAFAARLRSKIVLQPLGAHPVTRCFARVALHAAELDQLPAKVDVYLRRISFLAWARELRRRHLQIAHTHPTQPPKTPIDGKGERAAKRRAAPRGMRPRARATATTSPYSRSSRIVERNAKPGRSVPHSPDGTTMPQSPRDMRVATPAASTVNHRGSRALRAVSGAFGLWLYRRISVVAQRMAAHSREVAHLTATRARSCNPPRVSSRPSRAERINKALRARSADSVEGF